MEYKAVWKLEIQSILYMGLCTGVQSFIVQLKYFYLPPCLNGLTLQYFLTEWPKQSLNRSNFDGLF